MLRFAASLASFLVLLSFSPSSHAYLLQRGQKKASRDSAGSSASGSAPQVRCFLFAGGSHAVFSDPQPYGGIDQYGFGGLLWECADASDLEQQWLASFDGGAAVGKNKVEQGKIVKVVEHAGIAFYHYTGADFGGPRNKQDRFSWLMLMDDGGFLAKSESAWEADEVTRAALRLIAHPVVSRALKEHGLGGFVDEDWTVWPGVAADFWSSEEAA